MTLREIPLLNLELFGKTLKLENDDAGTQCLYWADEVVSKVDLSGITVSEIVHRFRLQQPNNSVEISLNLLAKDQTVAYQLWVDQHQVDTGEC